MPAWLIDAAMHLQAQAPPTTVHVDEPEPEQRWSLPWTKKEGGRSRGDRGKGKSKAPRESDAPAAADDDVTSAAGGGGKGRGPAGQASLPSVATKFYNDVLRTDEAAQRRCEDGSEFAQVLAEWREAERQAGRRPP